MLFLKQLCSLSFLLLSLALTGAKWKTGDPAAYQISRPLVGRPKGGQYKTILSVDSGGLRGMISSMVVIEIEHSIKQYLLDHPYYLPYHSGITSMDDFDINLVDYFDCMTGISAGSWSTLYLASRGGKGASRAVLDRQDIVEKYGVIPSGGAEGLRVLYKEFGAMIYPPEAIDTSAGEVGDLTNPFAPGVATPLYPLDGLVSTLDAFLGDTTLDDLDTSMLVPAFDLLSSHSVYFVHNMFRDVPVSSSARLVAGARLTHMTIDGRFVPNLVFDESKNYFLKDVGSASGAAPVSKPAMPVTPVDSDSMEFLCIDGVIPMDNSALRAAFFVAGENDFSGLRNIAILTLGNGIITADLSEFANAGLATWLAGFGIFDIYNFSGLESMDSLLDYFYYADPNTKPHQYLRIQVSAPLETEEGMSFTVFDQASLVDLYETIGIRIAKDHRESIDMFVRSFIFG